MQDTEIVQLRKEVERLNQILTIVVARNEELEQDLFSCLQTITNLSPLFSSFYKNAEALTGHISSLLQIADRRKINFSSQDETAETRKINFTSCHHSTDSSKKNFSSYDQLTDDRKINFSSYDEAMDSHKKNFSSYHQDGNDSKINFSSHDEVETDSKKNFTTIHENGTDQKINFTTIRENGISHKKSFTPLPENGNVEKFILQASRNTERHEKTENTLAPSGEAAKNISSPVAEKQKGTLYPFSKKPILLHPTETIDFFRLTIALREKTPKSNAEGPQNSALIMIRLYKLGKRSADDLMYYTDLSISGLSKRIASMKKHGWIKRVPGKGLVLTEIGIQLVESCKK